MKTDNLNKMFIKQINFQQKLNNDIHSIEFKRIMTLSCIDELMEALRETPWKPWKKDKTYHQDKFKEELIDAWHFLINLSLASGMTSDDVYNKFMEKNKENIRRQNNGY